MSDCQICGHDIDNHGRSGCCMHKCSCLRTHSHADHPSYAEQDARIAALTERAERAEKANALLRAECEAWREANGTHDWTGDADGPPYYITSVRIAMGMTDEAGALKGGGVMGHCDMIACNPQCLRCGDTPSCGDGSWGWMDGVHRHRCRDLHPQCGYDRVPCEKHQPEELIALLHAEVAALRITRDVKNAEVDRLTKDRDAQAEAVRVLGREVQSWWVAMEVDPLDGGNKETLGVYHNHIAAAAVRGGGE